MRRAVVLALALWAGAARGNCPPYSPSGGSDSLASGDQWIANLGFRCWIDPTTGTNLYNQFWPDLGFGNSDSKWAGAWGAGRPCADLDSPLVRTMNTLWFLYTRFRPYYDEIARNISDLDSSCTGGTVPNSAAYSNEVIGYTQLFANFFDMNVVDRASTLLHESGHYMDDSDHVDCPNDRNRNGETKCDEVYALRDPAKPYSRNIWVLRPAAFDRTIPRYIRDQARANANYRLANNFVRSPNVWLIVPALCPAGQIEDPGDALQTTCIACADADPGNCTPPQLCVANQQANLCQRCPYNQVPVGGGSRCGCADGSRPDATGNCAMTCPPGQVMGEGEFYGVCRRCSRGESWDGSGATPVCRPCGPGKFAPSAGSLSCQTCQPGTYNELPRAASCTPCGRGTVSRAGSASCRRCLPGQLASAQRTTCMGCAPNQLPTRTRFAESCRSCPAGMMADPTFTSCVSCPGVDAGTWSPGALPARAPDGVGGGPDPRCPLACPAPLVVSFGTNPADGQAPPAGCSLSCQRPLRPDWSNTTCVDPSSTNGAADLQ